jgi:hypothetical protein
MMAAGGAKTMSATCATAFASELGSLTSEKFCSDPLYEMTILQSVDHTQDTY